MVMDVQVELRIKAMQPVLIPGPEQIHPALGVLDVGESTYQDQGSVSPGYRPKPWCTGKQLPLGFNLTGPALAASCVYWAASCKLDSTKVKQRASSSTCRGQATSLTGERFDGIGIYRRNYESIRIKKDYRRIYTYK